MLDCMEYMDSYIFMLYRDSILEYVFYDIEKAIQEAKRLSLVLVRIRVREDGSATSMNLTSSLHLDQ